MSYFSFSLFVNFVFSQTLHCFALFALTDGYCKVSGQYWTLDFNSTYGTPCPPSEYTNEQMDNPWKPPVEESSGRSSFHSLHTTTTTATVLVGLTMIAWLLE
jgi:hypothetical protein